MPSCVGDPAAAGVFADVALPLPLEQPFTYQVPPSLHHRIAVGMRAVVPVKDRIHTGYVVAVKDRTAVKNLRAIVDLPDMEPVFSAEGST